MSSARFLELSRQQKKTEGVLEVVSLPRLKEALIELGVSDDHALDKVSVVYQLQGLPPRYFGDAPLPMLSLAVQTNLPLICQRCFAPMPQSMDVQFEFAICDEPPEALLEDEDVDWLESSAESTFESVVEDELLMALPIAVMHEGTCTPLQKTAGEKQNPFAALKDLKLDKK